MLEKGIVKLRRNFTDRIIRDIGKEISVDEKDEIQTGGSSRVKIYLNQKINLLVNSPKERVLLGILPQHHNMHIEGDLISPQFFHTVKSLTRSLITIQII